MSKNKTLSDAKSAKNDEFYTQYADIQKEINAYLDYNPDTFRGKTVLLPCDDPEWSKFTRFFAENFERLGLKKHISASYAAASKKIFNAETQRRRGEGRAPSASVLVPAFPLRAAKPPVRSRQDCGARQDIRPRPRHERQRANRPRRFGMEHLEGNDDFRSDEVCRLRDGHTELSDAVQDAQQSERE